LVPRCECPELIQKLLFARRFIEQDRIESLIQPKLADLKDPFLMMDMGKAVDRLLEGYQKNEKICIYADFDLDGTSGLALLSEGLRGLGFQNLILYQPKRLANGYGFHATSVQELAEQGVRLIVTVDVGINAIETVDVARSKGLDVIITDHHQPGTTLPNAFAIVNPNRSDDKSGLGYLCGAGVAFYLLRALMRKMIESNLIPQEGFDLKSVLDFFTIGTLTDMVPLIEDNRILVKHGLLKLSQTKRPGFRVLLDELGLSERTLNAQDVGIRFAPKLNALSRMEKGILPIDIMLEKNWEDAQSKIDFVMENNDDRVHLQSEGEREAIEALSRWEHEQFFFFTSAGIHRGVAGLIATKLCQITGKPSFIGSESTDGIIVGSARAPQRSAASVLRALSASSQFLSRFGGHHAASGFELFTSAKALVIQSLSSFYESKENNFDCEVLEYDFDLEPEQISEGFMKWIEALGPYGQGFPIPQFRIRNLEISNILRLRGGHLKLSFGNQKQKLDALYFSPPANFELNRSDRVQVIVELQWNYYQGQRTVQLLIKDIQREKGS